MRRATWGRCVSGRCCGVRESSSQPLTPKGTAPLLHCPDPRKARATFHGACPRRTRMAMPVARYIDDAGPGRLRRVTGGTPSVTPSAAPRSRRAPGLDHRSAVGRRPRDPTPEVTPASPRPARPVRSPPPGRGRMSVRRAEFSCPARPPRHSPQSAAHLPRGAKKQPFITVVRRSTDRITYAQPSIFSQLHTPVASLPNWPINPLATRQEETARYASTRRGWAIKARRTSLRGRRVKPFVIECFPPSCLVDITPVGELVTPAPRDAVDSILGIEDWGLVQDRGEKCRSDRPVRTRKTRTPRGA